MKETKRVMCFGTFDKFHPGHLFYLEESKKQGSELIVVVARDENVQKIKNKIPTQNEQERLEKLNDLELVDIAVLGDLQDRYAVLREYKPDIICLGYDQEADEEKLKKDFGVLIIRQRSYKPSIYKSSKILDE